jgi:hypothetical protein
MKKGGAFGLLFFWRAHFVGQRRLGNWRCFVLFRLVGKRVANPLQDAILPHVQRKFGRFLPYA